MKRILFVVVSISVLASVHDAGAKKGSAPRGRGIETAAAAASRLKPAEKDFVFGYASYHNANWDDAENFFKKCADLSVLADHVLYYRGRIALTKGDANNARELFERLIQEHPQSIRAHDAKLRIAEAMIALKRFDDARKQLDRYLKEADLDIERFDAELIRARSYISQGDEDGGQAILKRMAASVISESELAEMAKAGGKSFERWMKEPSVEIEIAQSLMEHSQWKDALSHLDAARSGGSDFETDWLYARCLFKAHQYREVVPILEKLLRNGGGGMRLTLLQHLASAYARIDDYEHSIALRRKIISEYPGSPGTVLDSTSKIAFLLLDDGHYKEAIDEFEKVLRMKGSASMRTKVLWYMAWSHYRLKDHDSAVRIMNELLKGGAKKGRIKMDDRFTYWKARSLENAGKKEEARSLYRKILGDHPIGYYGVLSKRRLDGDAQRNFGNFADARPHIWPKGEFSVRVPGPEDVKSSSPHLARAIVLDRMEIHEEGAKEIAASYAGEKGTDPDLIMYLASRNFAHNISYLMAQQRFAPLLKALPRSNGFERFVWEQSYPEAYRPLVEKLVAERFDPKIVYSIMRAESNFRPTVVSPAGAVGLMQLMPVTAQKMAHEMGDAGFDAHDLYRPSKNIGYGVQYLKKLSNLFPDNTVAMIASYNAGEEAVGRWLNHGYSPDVEEFIEEIPYDETNLYVKKVLMTYWILKQMY